MRLNTAVRLGAFLGMTSVLFYAPRMGMAEEPHSDLSVSVEEAQTPEDHEALAHQYNEEAGRMWQMAEDHKLMLQVYERKFGPRADKWRPHCEKLIEDYRKTSADYRSLAAAHQEEAKALKAQ